MSDGALILLIFGAGLVGFATERIHHDLVALLMLAASVLLGLVPAAEAFAGFGDPAVITVAAVMVLSAGWGWPSAATGKNLSFHSRYTSSLRLMPASMGFLSQTPTWRRSRARPAWMAATACSTVTVNGSSAPRS